MLPFILLPTGFGHSGPQSPVISLPLIPSSHPILLPLPIPESPASHLSFIPTSSSVFTFCYHYLRSAVFIMYAIKSFVAFFVLFVTFVNALPTQHMQLRRAWAHKRSSDAVLSKMDLESLEDTPVLEERTATKNTTTSTTSKISTGHSLLSALFPVSVETGNQGWTTVPGASGALALTSATFKPTGLKSFLSNFFQTAPDGQKAIKATYPKGSYRLGVSGHLGGLSFYTSGPGTVDLTTAKEATFGYSVMFDQGFQWNKGGKLPGFCKFCIMMGF